MAPIQGVNGPIGPVPSEAVGTTKGSGSGAVGKPAIPPGNSSGTTEAQRLQALQAFFAGGSPPVDLAALAIALIQEGVVSR
jgi:hypothetical protein